MSYFANDYAAANTAMLPHSTAYTTGASLYNGNIRSMFTALSDNSETALGTHQTSYTYDQLNRIKSMEGFNRVLLQNPTSSGYSSNYSFDANGNLASLQRYAKDGNGVSQLMDDFSYKYEETTVNNGNNNQLSWVQDLAGASLFDNADIDHSMIAGNYDYDAIGQLTKDENEDISSIEWTVTNKVKQITKETLGITIRFEYDGLGNRIAKHVTEGGDVTSTYYVLDAQGNVINVYTGNTRINDSGGTIYYLYLSERNLYGSSRLGQEQVHMELTQAAPFNYSGMLDNAYGDKRYELSNHLGNVLQVITDRKLPENDGTNHVAHYLADVVSYSDYFPYGMQMPGRNGNDGDGYRYGFNGHDKDDEVKGSGNSYDFGLRIYDPRVGRMFSIDPFSADYSWQSPYVYHRNNLIAWIDYVGGGDPPYPEKINGVYFVKLKNPTAKIIENYGMSSFTYRVMMQSAIPDGFSEGYSVNLQQYDVSYLNAAFRFLSPSTGSNEAEILGQNVQDGKVTGSKTSDNRGYLAQDQNGNWTGGLGNPPEDSKVAFGGGIPIIVAGRKYGEKAENGILSAKGYANQNSKDVGKVIIGYNSTDKSMMLVVSPDELEKGGMTLDAIRDKLANEGYDYVFGFDGGSSSTLIKGGSTKYVEPDRKKNNTIPTGVTITGDK